MTSSGSPFDRQLVSEPCSPLMLRCATRLVVLALALSSLAANALEFGPLHLSTPSGEPQVGEIVLTDEANGSEVVAWIATPQAFATAGLEYAPGLEGIRPTTRRLSKGRYALRLEALPAGLREYDLLVMASNSKAMVVLAEYRVDMRARARVYRASPVGTRLKARLAASPDSRVALAPSLANRTDGAAASPDAARNAAAAASASLTGPQRRTTDASAPAAGRPVQGPSARVGDVAQARSAAPSAPRAADSPAAARVAPPSAPASAKSDRMEAVRLAVRGWADAWSRRDVDAYVAAYVPGYAGRIPGVPRADWIEQRRKQIVRYRTIEITLSNLRMTSQGDAVVAEFDQTRRADRVKVKSRKMLEFVPVDGRWLIRREVNEF
jgi:hypothetical protein